MLASGFPKDHDIHTLLDNSSTRYVCKPCERDGLAQALAARAEALNAAVFDWRSARVDARTSHEAPGSPKGPTW